MARNPSARRSTLSVANWTLSARRHRRYRFLRVEPLEPRVLLNGSGLDDYGQVSPAWFAVAPAPGAGLNTASAGTSSAVYGPLAMPPQASNWIVRLNAEATASSVQQVEQLLDTAAADFQVLRGLGLPGQVLVRSFAPDEITRAALAANPHVATFESDQVVSAQVLPDDPDFSSMTGLRASTSRIPICT
ncbi:MAG: LEPR-XLL domain-containing protein [Planctomycetota bacterium]|nr:LEPR-XLL domain-containing protein [Planctomycetota bacterium]